LSVEGIHVSKTVDVPDTEAFKPVGVVGGVVSPVVVDPACGVSPFQLVSPAPLQLASASAIKTAGNAIARLIGIPILLNR
jgi:hypothetical protein